MLSEILSKIFWIVFEVAFIACMMIFGIRIEAAWKVYRQVKKDYALAPDAVKKGHTGKSKADIEKFIISAKVDLISWLCILLACVYACFDCFVWILKK